MPAPYDGQMGTYFFYLNNEERKEIPKTALLEFYGISSAPCANEVAQMLCTAYKGYYGGAEAPAQQVEEWTETFCNTSQLPLSVVAHYYHVVLRPMEVSPKQLQRA